MAFDVAQQDGFLEGLLCLLGKIIVWVVLQVLILVASLTGLGQAVMVALDAAADAVNNVNCFA